MSLPEYTFYWIMDILNELCFMNYVNLIAELFF